MLIIIALFFRLTHFFHQIKHKVFPLLDLYLILNKFIYKLDTSSDDVKYFIHKKLDMGNDYEN